MKFRFSIIVYALLLTASLAAGIVLQSGALTLFLDFKAVVLILAALILQLLLTGGANGTAMVFYDLCSGEVRSDSVSHYRTGRARIVRAGRGVMFFGFLGALIGFTSAFHNLDQTPSVGVAIHFADNCLMALFAYRLALVHPAALAFDRKMGEIHRQGHDASGSLNTVFPALIFLLLMVLLPFIILFLLRLSGVRVAFIFVVGAAVLVLGMVFFAACIGLGFRGFFTVLRRALAGNRFQKEAADQDVRILKRLGKMAVEAGLTGVIVKLIIMLAVLVETDLLLAHFAWAAVPLGIGLLLAGAVFYPLAYRLETSALPAAPQK